MKHLRQAGPYLLMLIIAVAAIVAVVDLGNALPSPSPLPPSQDLPSQAPSAVEVMLQTLKGNLNHPLSHLFMQLLVVIVAGRVIGKLFVRLGLPTVVGEMSAGIVLGPSLFGLLAPDAFGFVFPAESLGTLRLLSQVGICLFMFTVGMELSISHVRQKASTAVAVSHAGIVAPFLLGVILAYFLFAEMAGPKANFVGFAMFLGISMSITAFPVLARILQERKISRSVLGSMAITCAAVDDVTAWSIMAFVVAIAQASSIAASTLTLLLSLCFIMVMTFVLRPALPVWIGPERLARDEPSSGTLALIVCIVIAAALSTETIGIHALFGAFLAGAVMPDSGDFRRKIALPLEKFSHVLLLPLFFAFTGLRTEIGLLSTTEDWVLCLVIIGIATLGKVGGSAIAARMTGMSWRESLQLGALINTRGLMELIALNIGYDLGILSPRIFTMLVIMAVITTMMTGPLLTLLGLRQSVLANNQEPSRA